MDHHEVRWRQRTELEGLLSTLYANWSSLASINHTSYDLPMFCLENGLCSKKKKKNENPLSEFRNYPSSTFSPKVLVYVRMDSKVIKNRWHSQCLRQVRQCR